MLSGQWSIRVSWKERFTPPRFICSPFFTATRPGPRRKWSASAFTPIAEAKTASGFTAAIVSGRQPEWSISEWFEMI